MSLWTWIPVGVIILVLLLLALLSPAARLTAGILLMILGFIGTVSVMGMFIGLPIMALGLVIVLLDLHGRRAAGRISDRTKD